MTLAKPVALAAGALLLIAVPALAQDKIAPTHTYGNDNYNTYSDTPRERPDKNYGLPSFGMPGSELPQQKTMATPGPGAPTGTPTGTPGTARSTRPGPSQADTDASLPPAPGTGTGAAPAPGANAGGDSAPDLDFFSKQSSNRFLPKPGSHLSKPARSAASDDETDTPMFTTSDGPQPSDDSTMFSGNRTKPTDDGSASSDAGD